jgi:diaminopimelate decarboxylase
MKNIKKGPRVLLFILWEVIMKISGCDLVELKKEYGTPLYIFDRSHIKRNIDGYLNNFKSNQFKG